MQKTERVLIKLKKKNVYPGYLPKRSKAQLTKNWKFLTKTQ